MILLPREKRDRAALAFAEGFWSDPAFSLLLEGQTDALAQLICFFENYLACCKDLMLFSYSEKGEGYLCLYRYDTPFASFAVPPALQALEEFQHVEQYYESNFAVLDILTVEPECRGRGLAGEMIDFFVEYCKGEGLLPVVEVFSDRHLSLYTAHGFEVVHSHTHRGITTYLLEYRQ